MYTFFFKHQVNQVKRDLQSGLFRISLTDLSSSFNLCLDLVLGLYSPVKDDILTVIIL